MCFKLSEEQEQLRRWAHGFAEKEIRPIAAECDEKEFFPLELFHKATKLGFTQYAFPEEVGGGGLKSVLSTCLIGEELYWGCAGIATSLSALGLAGLPILYMGNEEQKKKWLTHLCDNKSPKLGAMALTEPEAGSDVNGMKTRAIRDGDEWVLNGRKRFITNGGIADLYVVFARTDPEGSYQGVSAFIIEANTPGLSGGKKEKKMGIRASHTADVILEDVRVPADQLLGQENMAFFGAMKMLEYSRPAVAAAAVGVARAAYEYALDYAHTRKQFGRPIFKNQAIAFMLAEMRMKIDAARLLAWRAADQADRGESCAVEGSIAKAYAAEVAMEVTTNAVQILGGNGYMRDYPTEKWMRDAKILSIYEGTTQIQKKVISAGLQ
ncbi:acyl-CoA dehydrogenase family protein [Mechercharimyces sp. CAU 1602]|uniref:acyl-CoA dehydrogenase family protein n=1 Tax=Mechercharimyces sp. CAU 1602 TaxID=2973933 RepID=UPI0021614C4F|nr:acyl-CoA dehydrogenase family protein [Mechercharimyces sp. CAU 1602]MCS1349976.1 acyl-CoA dehydrogenase family protein [Mechercharimyces sp. CAU 1602]